MERPTTTRHGTILVVGSLNVDLRLEVERHPRPGETLIGRGGEYSPGGKGANQAAAAALLGGTVAMVGAVGDDAHAAVATSVLREAGVDLSAVRTVPGPTGLAVVSVAAGGENSITVIPGANASVDAAAVESCAPAIGEAAVVVVQGEIPADGIIRALDLASGQIVVNLAPVIDLPAHVLRRADPLVVNEHEGALALRLLQDSAPADAHAGSDSPEETVRALLDAGIPSVVMTVGGDGAHMAAAGQTPTHIPSPQVQVVDTTGAGDAFVGALAWRLAAGDDLADACRVAARAGAYACTGEGAQASYARDVADLPSS